MWTKEYEQSMFGGGRVSNAAYFMLAYFPPAEHGHLLSQTRLVVF
jgi:hypothetical protein